MKTLNHIKLLWLVILGGLLASISPAHAVTLNKSFGSTVVNAGDATTLTVTIFNDSLAPLTNAGWTDNLPTGMTIQASPLPVHDCGVGAVVTANAGAGFVSLSGGTVPASVGGVIGQCSVTVSIKTTVQGNSVNQIPAGALNNTELLTNSALAQATLQVRAFADASISTTLNPSTIYLGQTASYTVTLTNNDNMASLTQGGWSYTLPAGLVVNGTVTAGANCGTPTITSSLGSGAISLANATIPKAQSCTLTIPITGNVQGNYSIALPIGVVTSYQGVSNLTASTQSIAVQSFAVSKAFSISPVRTNQESVLSITISSVGAYDTLAFTDDFSAQTGLVIAPAPTVTNTCNVLGGATVTATPGSQKLILSGGSIAAGSFVTPATCTVSVHVVVPNNADAGAKTNSLAIGVVTGQQGGTLASNINPTSAILNVTGYTPPTLAMALSKSASYVGEIINLTIAVTNNDATTFTNLGWTDVLPAGMVVAGTATRSVDCGGTPVVTAPLAGVGISLSGVSLANTKTCTITIPVKATQQGVNFTNNMAALIVTNDQGTGNLAGASVTLSTASTFTAVKKINGAATTANMSVGQPTKLRVEFSNYSTDSYNSLAFTDNFTVAPSTLPATFVMGNPLNSVTTCGGSIVSVAGANSFSFSGGILAAGTATTPSTCYVEVEVFASASFTGLVNAISAVSAASDLTATAASSATTSVSITAAPVTPPTISTKSFSSISVAVGGATTLTVSVKNNDATTTLTSLTWADNFPVEIVATAVPTITTAAACGAGATATVTVNPGTGVNTLTLSGVSLASGAICTVTVPVKGTKQGVFTNTINAGAITNAEGIPSTASASATLTVTTLAVSKLFRNATDTATVTDINVGETAKLKITLSNLSSTESYTALAMADDFSNFKILPAGTIALQVATVPNASTTCTGGSVVTTAQSVSLSGVTLAAGASCTVTVDVTAMATIASTTNTIPATTGVTATAVSNGTTAWNIGAGTAALQITNVAPPTFSAKSFATSPIFMGQDSQLTISVKNNDATATLSNVNWVDTFPAGLVTTGAATNISNCGTPTISGAGLTSISFSGGTILPNTTCTFKINVTGIAASITTSYTNQIAGSAISAVESAQGTTINGTGNSPAAVIQVKSLELSKSFASSVNVGGVTTLTLNITNNTTTAYSGINLTDDFSTQTGLVIASTPNIQNLGGTGCTTGTVTAVAGGTSISLTGFALAAGTSAAQQKCTVKVDVVGNVSGTKTNSLAVGALTATTPATQNILAASATLTVNAPALTVAKTFTVNAANPANTIVADGVEVALLRITITNPNNLSINTLNFTDSFPAGMTGLVIANSAAAVSTCPGVLTATAGTRAVTLAGGAADVLAAGASCYVEVPVVSTGLFFGQTNTVAVSAKTSAAENIAAVSASANLSANGLTVSNAFAVASVLVANGTQLTITINNRTASTQSSVVFTDTFAGSLALVDTPNGMSNSCGGTVTATAGSNSVRLSGGNLAANSSCTITVNVKGNIAGVLSNTVSVTSNQQTTAAISNTATLTVINPSVLINTVTKTFSPASIPLMQNSRASITWSAASGSIVNPIVTDNLPTGMLVASVPNVAASCATGTQPTIGSTTISPSRNQISVGLNLTQIAAQSCTILFDVTPTQPGVLTNTIAKGNIVSADLTAANTVTGAADLTVTNVMTIGKAFQPNTLGPNGVSTLTITLTNPETIVLTNVNLTDNLPNLAAPNNLLIANPPNATTNCTLNGSSDPTKVTAVAGQRAISLVGGIIPPQMGGVNGVCTVTVSVTPAGAYNSGIATNTINALTLTSAEGRSNINTASDTITFTTPSLAVVKGFSPTSVTGGSVSRLTVTITNPAGYAQTGLAFTDAMPPGMTIGAPPNPSTTCTGGVFSGVTVGSGTWSFSGGTVPAYGSCDVSLNATSNVNGNLTNVIPINGLSSANGGRNSQAASASLSNLPGLSVSKSFSPNPAQVNQKVRMTFVITNTNPTTTATQLAFTDDLTLSGTQSGLTVAVPPNASNTCGGSFNTTTTSIQLSNGTLNPQTSCRIDVDLATNTAGMYRNTLPSGTLTAVVNGVSVHNGQPGTDTAQVYAAIRVANQLVPTGDAGRFVLTMTPSAAAGVSSRANVGHDATPTAVSAFLATPGTPYTLSVNGQGVTNIANYLTTYSCANADNVVLLSGTGTSVTITPPTTGSGASKNQQDITCTFVQTRRSVSATVVLRKTWVSATLNDAVNVLGTGLVTLNSVATTANKTDTGISNTVATGSVITLSETFTQGSAANYTASWSCTGTTGLSANVLTVGPTDTAIVCTLTNVSNLAAPATLTGTVFKDTGTGAGGVANNGLQDGSEAGIAGVTVKVNQAGCPSGVCATAITDGSGRYSITLPLSVTGAVTLVETNLAGMLSSGGSVGNTVGTYTRATDSTAFNVTTGVNYTGVDFADVPENQLLTDGAKVALPGATVWYPHRFVAGTAGNVVFSLSKQSSPVIVGWNELIYGDTNCNATLDAGEVPVLASVAVTAGQTICLLVKEFVPAAAAVGAQNALTLTADVSSTFSGTAVAFSYVRHDTTTVGQPSAAGLTLVKSVSSAAALPGANIVYSVVYTNNSSSALSNVVINDATPAYTLFQSASCGVLPLNFTACNITSPAVGAAGSIVYTFVGTLAPAASGTVSFTVQVQP